MNGTDYKLIAQAADQVKNVLNSVEGTTDVRLFRNRENLKCKSRLIAQSLRILVYLLQMCSTLRVALTGDDESNYRDGTTNMTFAFSSMVKLFAYRKYCNITFMNNRGQLIELKQFADVFMTPDQRNWNEEVA